MKTQFARYLVTISLIMASAITPTPTWSCGPELYPDEARFCLFHADVSDEENLTIFNYTPSYLSYNLDSASTTDMDRNCTEWRSFTKNKVPVSDINEIQYNTNADSFVRSYLSGNMDKYNSNRFVRWLLKRKNKKALQYFVFAKQLEYLQTEANSWDTSKIQVQYDSLARYAYSMCEKNIPEFLKERYAFQAVKCFYYSRYYPDLNWDFTSPELAECYQKHLKNKSSIVASWALIYYARVQEDANKQTLYLARCFDRCDDKKSYIYQFLDLPRLQSLETVTKNTKDLVLIHALKAILTPGRALKDLQYIYENDPCNKYIPLLITREINKLEDWIYSPEVLGFSSIIKENAYERDLDEKGNRDYINDTPYNYYAQKNVGKDRIYLKQFRDLLLTMSKNECTYKDLLHLSIAHLYNMDHQGGEAQKYIAKASSDISEKYKRQAAIETFISITQSEDITTQHTKQRIAEALQTLAKLGVGQTTLDPWDNEGDYETDDDFSEILVYLGREYQRKNDLVTAGLLLQKANIGINEYGYGYPTYDSVSYPPISFFEKHAQPADIEKLIALKHKKGKREFEKLLTPAIWAADNLLLDLEATLFLRKEDYQSAWKIMQKIPDDFWRDNYEYKNYLPKTSISDVGTLLPVPSGPNKKYPFPSKKLILQDIIHLQIDLQTRAGIGRAHDYFLLGNAYYNMTYYGKAWMMSAYGQSGGEGWDDNYNWVYYNISNNNTKCHKNYYGCKSAMDMYQKALAYSKTDKELAAKCLVMLAYCDNLAHQNYSETARGNYSEEQREYYSPYLYKLRKQYSGTNTFARSVSYCPDISEFVAHKK